LRYDRGSDPDQPSEFHNVEEMDVHTIASEETFDSDDNIKPNISIVRTYSVAATNDSNVNLSHKIVAEESAASYGEGTKQPFISAVLHI